MQQSATGISPEIVAAITAALATMLDQPVGSFAITSIQPGGPAYADAPAPTPPVSGWARAGVLESHLGRRQFGFRNR